MDDQRDFAGASDEFSHLICCERSRFYIVRRSCSDRDIAIYPGVKADDRDIVRFRFLQQR
ncbi:hypothetical protein D3C71_2147050 [compost metagenome]